MCKKQKEARVVSGTGKKKAGRVPQKRGEELKKQHARRPHGGHPPEGEKTSCGPGKKRLSRTAEGKTAAKWPKKMPKKQRAARNFIDLGGNQVDAGGQGEPATKKSCGKT